MKLSAVIVTFNEEENIRDCLESVKGLVDEIVVVDSGSKDRTCEICKEYTERVIYHKWSGHVNQKNYAISLAKGEWVLCLDADERVSDDLAKEIQNLIQGSLNIFDGYYIPRKVYYLGRWISHCGWYPDYKLRLFRKGKGIWTGVDPHDRVSLNGRKAYLTNPLLHFPYKSIYHHIEKINNYTTIIAKEKYQMGRKSNLTDILFKPPLTFIKKYLLKGGFREGIPGFLISILSSYYVFLKYGKLWELWKKSNEHNAC
jgi:glycosyltransferase involved in cell wall biosynthesis